MKLVKKELINRTDNKFDLTVSNNHNYIVEGVVVHNSNCRLGLVLKEGEWYSVAGSRTLQRKDTGNSTYWMPFEKYPKIKELLEDVKATIGATFSVILYGEIFGAGVQGGFNYGRKEQDFVAFDISVDGKYLGATTFVSFCDWFEVPMVPILNDEYEIEFSFDRVVELSKGKSVLGGDHIREGVVVKPFDERNEPNIGRVVLKYVSDDFLHKNVKEDTTDQ